MPTQRFRFTIYNMPKRKYGGGSSSKKKAKATSKLDKAYKKVVRKKVTAKKKRVVRKSKSKALDAMAMLRHPATALVKFRTSICNTFTMGSQFNNHLAGNGNANSMDQNPVFPTDGIKIRLNDIYNPWGAAAATLTGNVPAGTHATGFDNISRQYAKYRVVGSKLTIKFRRMGGTVPYQGNPATAILQPVSLGGTPTQHAGSAASQMGTLFDPSNADPLLCMIIDRSAWQDANSQITEESIDEYKDIMRYKGMKGLKWRELKAGAGMSATITHKWSEKSFQGGAGHNTDRKQANTGLFHPEAAGVFVDGGASPTTPDELVFKIKQFDKASPYHKQFKNARIMVTADIEYIVKCFESKYSYQQGSGQPM